MREQDIKMLWGRSGNRCAICRLELAPIGSSYTLGEMAHIVARAENGPRGKDDIPARDRDLYPNRILLCPSHHVEIDGDTARWSVPKLHKTKAEHEVWVTEQLGHGRITVAPVDNDHFLEGRAEQWENIAAGRVCFIISLTPLSVSDGDTLDPLDPDILECLNNCRPPSLYYKPGAVNRYHTRPNENGIVNDQLQADEGHGHSIQIFRNGHCEYFLCIQKSVDQVTSAVPADRLQKMAAIKVIRYEHLAIATQILLEDLSDIWRNCLPLIDMTLTVELVCAARSTLFPRELGFGEVLYGSPVSSAYLRHREVVNSHDEPKDLIETTLRRFSNYYGLDLKAAWDDAGKFIRPERLEVRRRQVQE